MVWAVERAVPRTTELFRLVTRGLPLLLLLVTFLFINTEAWQVAASLERTRLWFVVAFFAAIILAFLAVRLARRGEPDVGRPRSGRRCRPPAAGHRWSRDSAGSRSVPASSRVTR